jgi:hypothetical protein
MLSGSSDPSYLRLRKGRASEAPSYKSLGYIDETDFKTYYLYEGGSVGGSNIKEAFEDFFNNNPEAITKFNNWTSTGIEKTVTWTATVNQGDATILGKDQEKLIDCSFKIFQGDYDFTDSIGEADYDITNDGGVLKITETQNDGVKTNKFTEKGSFLEIKATQSSIFHRFDRIRLAIP